MLQQQDKTPTTCICVRYYLYTHVYSVHKLYVSIYYLMFVISHCYTLSFYKVFPVFLLSTDLFYRNSAFPSLYTSKAKYIVRLIRLLSRKAPESHHKVKKKMNSNYSCSLSICETMF